MPHATRSSAAKMHGGRPRNSLRSNSLGRLSAVCIRAALNRVAKVALATCHTCACHARCDMNFLIQQPLESMTVKVNYVQLESPLPWARIDVHRGMA